MEDLELPDPNYISYDEILIDATDLLEKAGQDLARVAEAIEQICLNAVGMNNDIRANLLFDILAKKFKITKTRFTSVYKQTKALHQEKIQTTLKLPGGLDYEETAKRGFFVQNNCYMFLTKDEFFKASNFTMLPLYHIYSKNDNKRLIEINNEWNHKRVVDVASGKFISVEQFQQLVFAEGNYIFFGTRVHFLRIIDTISNSFPIANELITLGWQREGFYAFANGIFNSQFQEVNEFGITKHNDHLYFSPSFSKIYSDVREDDDSYENDRFFVYKKPAISFSEWSKLFLQVYGEKARIGIAFMISSLFRDIIYEKFKFFPHLFLFGEKQSGKSQFAWSLSNIFFDSLPSFNLNSGTQVGFFRRLSRIKNALCWFDEYSNDIDERRFQSLKAAYDGTGHEKGKKSTDGRTEITKVQSACVISGQYLPSRDDNALLTRSILLNFERQSYDKESVEYYEKLKEFEITGLSGILSELLPVRDNLVKYFSFYYSEIYNQLKDSFSIYEDMIEERLIRNIASILTPVKIIEKYHTEISLPFRYSEVFEQSSILIRNLSRLIASSESISTFWTLVEYMVQNHLIRDKEDFKINTITVGSSVDVINKYGNASKYTCNNQLEEILFLRLSRVHPTYLELHRKQFGKNGMDISTCIHYLTVNPAYIGRSKATRFGNINTSAFVFHYTKLNINLTEFRDISGTGDDDFSYNVKTEQMPVENIYPDEQLPF